MASKLSFLLEDADGDPQPELRVQVKNSGGTTVVSTDDESLVDNSDGTYTTASTLAPGVYSVYTGAGAGTLVPGLQSVSHVDAAILPTALPVPLSEGGTGATTAADARSALGVQAYSSYLSVWGGSYLPFWITSAEGGVEKWASLNAGVITCRNASEMRTALGLGSAAVEDASAAPAAGQIPIITSDSALDLPERTSGLSAASGNYGKFYLKYYGNTTTGGCGLYAILKTAAGYAETQIGGLDWDYT